MQFAQFLQRPHRVYFFFTALFFPFVLSAAELPEGLRQSLEAGEFDAVAMSARQSAPQTLGAALNKAHELQLAKTPMWKALLRYQSSFFGMVSQVDDPTFFLSDTGQTNPERELDATIVSFYSTRPSEPTSHTNQCRFVARFAWLDQQLNFSEFGIQKEECEDYFLYRKLVQGDTLTVVFPVSHPNGPSSMFGHTLLRIDKSEQTRATRMLAYSVNYAAQIDPNVNAFSYAFNGLAGGFIGKFSVVPYYTKLREYAQMENRDVWEYTLRLTSEQVDWVLKYVYELNTTYFQYYFFTENCSYHLLSLLDVAFPDQPLTSDFGTWTIPIDTVNLLQHRGLITKAEYQPSQARQIRQRRESVSGTLDRLAREIFHSGLNDELLRQLESLPDTDKIAVLDLVADFFHYQKLEDVQVDQAKLSESERAILKVRARIKMQSVPIEIDPPSVRPEQGHGTGRIGLGAGRLDTVNFSELSWRPAYHGLIDPSGGYSMTGAVSFFDVSAHYVPSENSVVLHRLKLLELTSLEPMDAFFRHVSWNLLLDWRRRQLPDDSSTGVSSFQGGGGVTLDFGSHQRVLFYSLVSAKLAESSVFEQEGFFGPGLSVGLVAQPMSRWRFELNAYYYKNAAKGEYVDRGVSFDQSVQLHRDWTLNMRITQTRLFATEKEMSAGVNWFF